MTVNCVEESSAISALLAQRPPLDAVVRFRRVVPRNLMGWFTERLLAIIKTSPSA